MAETMVATGCFLQWSKMKKQHAWSKRERMLLFVGSVRKCLANYLIVRGFTYEVEWPRQMMNEAKAKS